MKWSAFIQNYSSGDEALFDAAFTSRWDQQEWAPSDEDKKAAAKLYVQMVSRIATQHLGYLDGVEKTALKSVYDLFEHTRTICTTHSSAGHFMVIAWHVLNTHVRPFTAKWHPRSERGMLSALDTTDEFRAELTTLQRRLRKFEQLLAHLRDGQAPPEPDAQGADAKAAEIIREIGRSVPWGIDSERGDIKKFATAINDAEKEAIGKRRQHYAIENPAKSHAVALALSGGGIRSATFSLGVLVALAKRGLLPQFDYLSTVSGGGYLGSFLTAYLNTPTGQANNIGLGSGNLPFRRESGEAEALRHLRHHSKYLATGSLASRLSMAAAQLYGMALNGIGVVFVVAALTLGEHWLRSSHIFEKLWCAIEGGLALLPAPPALAALWSTPLCLLLVLLMGWAIVSLILVRRGKFYQKVADAGLVILGVLTMVHLLWLGLETARAWVAFWLWPKVEAKLTLPVILGAIPAISSALSGLSGKVLDRVKLVLVGLSILAAPLFLISLYFVLYPWVEESPYAALVVAALAVIYFFFLNINFTSPHRHYRNKLAEAYLIQPKDSQPAGAQPNNQPRVEPSPKPPFNKAVEVKLSKATSDRAPYHLINTALNVPGSKDLKMQGRLTDFFLFSQAFCGSPLIGYRATKQWEDKDPHLDLGTAMAISGAAAAPQMGLGTKKRLSFWLALLNIRLGYWVRDPGKSAKHFGGAPGLWFLLKEMLGSMNERSPWLYLSDGGHIENLAIYELLRRRCQYIVAIDGEQDERMTFAGLTTLQRLAAIDLGVKIDIDLDDLRLNELGLSRSHFRFCRIEYPGQGYGYLLYVKLSLTGNEGEFLRRYRLDEPAFPHHSTADQFFTEAQFEAYRSLGEHIGDKLFLRALVGDEMAESKAVKIEDLFRELGKRLLEPVKNGLP